MACRVVVLFVLLILTDCRGRTNQQNGVPDIATPAPDSTYLFDGKSLDGWEITNFGPQGPVSVSIVRESVYII